MQECTDFIPKKILKGAKKCLNTFQFALWPYSYLQNFSFSSQKKTPEIVKLISFYTVIFREINVRTILPNKNTLSVLELYILC